MNELSRRSLMLGAGALSLAGGFRFTETLADGHSGWVPGKKTDQWQHLMRMQMSLASEDVVWWYIGRIYGMTEDGKPRHLYNLEGTEIIWPRRLENGSYVVSGRTLTFFRDKQTGKMLRDFENPYTEKINEVVPNRFAGKDGIIYSNEGWAFSGEVFPDTIPQPWGIEWHRSGPSVWFTSSRYSSLFPQPWLESMTVFGDLKSFSDPKIANIQTNFSSTFLSPWPEWMGMGDTPGHLVWHSSGRKLTSADEIPADYRQRVDEEYDGLLTAAPNTW